MYDITLVTEDRYAQPANPDWYEQQILNEDGLVRTALESHGLKVHRVSWSDPGFDWSTTRMAVLRTTWDYFYRFGEFTDWLQAVAAQTRLINIPELLRWNMDKRYLLDLQRKGVAIPPTRLVLKGGAWNLYDSFAEWGVAEIIIKPCVGGTARHTHRIPLAEVGHYQRIFDELVGGEHFLIQPFLSAVLDRGEVSVLLFNGVVSHAVIKRAKAGDFRVQDDFGGTVAAHTATDAERALAVQAINACPSMPLYARADMMYNQEGIPVISELEMVEPELFFRFDPAAANRYGEAIGAFFAEQMF